MIYYNENILKKEIILPVKYILYNPISGNGKAKEYAEALKAKTEGEVMLADITGINKYDVFFNGISEDEELIICGGDGTLNKFINAVSGIEIRNKIYYYPAGTGNDFCMDVGMAGTRKPFLINSYIKNLPTVNVNGTDYKFINGVGYGIDGYCCEVGDALREENKKANYTAIAIKGLLFHYKPTNAKVTVDGKEYNFKKVWLAPTMFGSHYGGGMIPTPSQSRESESAALSLMVFHGTGKIKTLMIFPSIFKGEHIKHKKNIEVLSGNSITVSFDRPTALQIDGETLLNVSEYTARI